MKKEAGFTLVEVLAVVVLLGMLLSLIYNVMVQNAFQQKRTKNEMEAQNSAKALLNHIGEVVMEQNVPIVSEVNSDTEYSKDTIYENIDSMKFNDTTKVLEKIEGNKYKLNGKEYAYITAVDVTVKERGITVTVIGESDKSNAEFSSSFYTRNM